MLARVCVRFFGTIWKLKERCNNSSGILRKFYIFLYNWYQYEHGSAISYKVSFAELPILPRGTKQIVITQDVIIGKKATIFQQVTIQNDTFSNIPSKSPVIGNNCYIYPGAKIIGELIIGDNVIIGPNVVVTSNIPSNTKITLSEMIQLNTKTNSLKTDNE